MFKSLFLACVLALSSISCFTKNEVRITPSSLADKIEDRLAPVKLKAEMADPTFFVESHYEGLGVATGSAVAISDKVLISAYHVVSPDPVYGENGEITGYIYPKISIQKSLPDGLFISTGKVLAFDLTNDLVAIGTEVATPYFASILPANAAFSRFPLFTSVFASGHPAGVAYPTLTDGRIQQFQDWLGKTRFSYSAWFGNSGGPVFVFSDGKWRLYSIVQALHVSQGLPVTWLQYGVATETLYRFMEGLPSVR